MNTLDVIYIASIFYIFWSIVKIFHFLYYIILNFKTVFQTILGFFNKIFMYFKNKNKKTVIENTTEMQTQHILPFSQYNSKNY